MSIITYSELTYDRPLKTYVYPDWAVGVGWGLAASTAIWIPLTAIYKIISYSIRGKVRRNKNKIIDKWKTFIRRRESSLMNHTYQLIFNDFYR